VFAQRRLVTRRRRTQAWANGLSAFLALAPTQDDAANLTGDPLFADAGPGSWQAALDAAPGAAPGSSAVELQTALRSGARFNASACASFSPSPPACRRPGLVPCAALARGRPVWACCARSLTRSAHRAMR